MDPEELSNASYWLELAPRMSIDGAVNNDVASPTQSMARLSQRMARDGYFQERDQGLAELAPRLAEAITLCTRHGLPAVFVWLYDQPWQCFSRLRPIIGHFLGADHKMLPDFWAWHIDPRTCESGWAPHVDRSGTTPLGEDGSPLSLTCWVPITEAHPLNSCMYIVPAHLDPFYGRPAERDELPQPNTIRALPSEPGDYLVWNQAVLHWGSRSSEFADTPRMSMAIEFQRGDIGAFNSPLLNMAPTFENRLWLVGKQILQYRHMYAFSDELVAVARHFQSIPFNLQA